MRRFVKPVVMGAAALAASSAMAGVTFYEHENFGGRRMTMDDVVPNLVARGYSDRARSAVVEGAPVEVCMDINFNTCTILNPGRYPQLGRLGDQISSIRTTAVQPPRADDRRGEHWASATLFSGPNMTGRPFTLGGRGSPNLQDFNDRASSLRVERGYWIFCSEPNFRGECRTFGPGEYSQLPPGLDNRIASGRRIANNYPYAQNPDWGPVR